MEEKDIYNQKLPIEQKMFFFDLKTTPQGEYLKITEKACRIVCPIYLTILHTKCHLHGHQRLKY